jgi:Leucine-rich repeat (LRR) protein
MAATLVGGAFLSATLQVLFDRMASQEVVNFIRGRKVPERLLKKLKTSFLALNAVLVDAEEKEITNTTVKEWLEELKDAVYDAEDLLDEIATEALKCMVEADFVTFTSKVRNFIPTSFNWSEQKLKSKIEEVLVRLEDLAKQKDVLGLREGVGGKSSQRLPTTSLVEESKIYGRDFDKEPIVNMLLSNDAESNDHPRVIPIVGMGGVGKTTLAQLIYNDQRITEHFNLKYWVCVSQEFDIPRITKTILEDVTSDKCNTTNFNMIQTRLKESLVGKKFLLVLDDVWNEKYDDWEEFKKPFKYGALGSKIIVTTRNESVASIMCPIQIFNLNKLSEDDCWLLFANHAFENGNFNAYPHLEEIGKQIVKKCDGLPLAAKALGALLHCKLDAGEWYKVLKSKIWSLPKDGGNILPALRLSYNDLPSHLKRCFAYCSTFPKDYEFKKEELVQLWMAEGFLHKQEENEEMEDIGDEYFLDLVSRSLLQQSDRNKLHFVMHDLIHDLAKFVSGRFCFSLEGENANKIIDKTRHFSYLRMEFDTSKKFEALYKAKHLRTFLPLELNRVDGDFYLTKEVSHDLLLKLRFLRVLSLSHYTNIKKLPESIGDSKHLRYLDLSCTKVERLPNSICKLCNLQTLNLSGCEFLDMLPSNMRKLTNLRHLDVTGTRITRMPMQMGRLKCLRTLTKFVVGKDSEFQIGELGELTNLRGAILILKLQNVINSTDALKAKLKAKRHLEALTLEWEDTISQRERDVLNQLEPHTNLKKLVINNYGGTSFPNWVGHCSFSNMTCLHLSYCRNCPSLPSLGQLPSLQDLCIVGFDEVVTVGLEFYGSSSSNNTPFRSLEILKFEEMLKWEEWFPHDGENEGAFLCLRELYLIDCPKLRGSLPKNVPYLTKIMISKCLQLETSLPTAAAMSYLELMYCNDLLLKELPPTLHVLIIQGFNNLESLPEEAMEHNHCLEELTICDCPMLKSLPRGDLPTSLKTLFISNCRELEFPTCYSSLESLEIIESCNSLTSFPLDIFPKLYHLKIEKCSNMESLSVLEGHHLIYLSWLEILDCPNFVAFPNGGLSAPNLLHISVSNCERLNSLPENMHTLLLSLEYLRIGNCPQVESFPEGGLPSNLIEFFIDSEKLFGTRMEWGLQRLHSLQNLGIGGAWLDVESFPEEDLLPTSLSALGIVGFPNLRSLDLQHLPTLQQLVIMKCPELKHMPEEGLPVSISHLLIEECPLLTKRLQRKKRKGWRNIARNLTINIDGEVII